MLQPPENKNSAQPTSTASNYTPMKGSNAPLEQASIGRSLVIKGEVSGGESLYIDGRIEGTINIPDHRITIGRNGAVTADINACDVVTPRISVEDGAHLRGSVQVQASEQKKFQPQAQQAKPVEAPKPVVNEP